MISILVHDTIIIIGRDYFDIKPPEYLEIIKLVSLGIMRASDMYITFVFFGIIKYYYLRAKQRFMESSDYECGTFLGLPRGS